jgi:hypothetical protein
MINKVTVVFVSDQDVEISATVCHVQKQHAQILKRFPKLSDSWLRR